MCTMSSTPNNASLLSRGLVVAAIAASQLAIIIPTGEAFSAVAPSTTRATRATTSSSSRGKCRSSSVTTFGSLRDLISESHDYDVNQNLSEGDATSGSPRGNLANFSRSKFADTRFRARSVYGTGSDADDEGGLHADRLSTFSFSSISPSSKSQGGPLASEEVARVAEVPPSEDAAGGPSDVASVSDSPDNFIGEGKVQSPNIHLNSHMVGINYSKRKQFPRRTRGKISDEEDQLGLNRDRLSTFSFSGNRNRPSAARRSRSPPAAEEGDGAGAGEEGDGVDLPPVAGRGNRVDDQSFGVDNFHNNVNIDRSATKLGSLASRTNPAAATSDGQTNHADRLSTFSLSSMDNREDGREDPPPDGVSVDTPVVAAPVVAAPVVAAPVVAAPVVAAPVVAAPGVTAPGDALGDDGAIPPPREASNHMERLGTFSFASADPGAGDPNARPPRPDARGGSTGPPGGPGPAAPPGAGGGSLSSIASSVSVKSRNERILEVRARTDPRRLHPDGMNTPRMNRKGEVQSMSNFGGRPTIFQRIDAISDGDEGDAGDGAGDDRADRRGGDSGRIEAIQGDDESDVGGDSEDDGADQ